MNRRSRQFGICMLCLAFISGLVSVQSAAETVEPGGIPSQLSALRESVASQGAVWAQFTEERRFPFRKDAVVLRGELVFSTEKGLSLLYMEPEERRVVVSGGSVRIREAEGSEESRQMASRFAFLEHVLAFDVEALAKDFAVQFDAGEVWRLNLKPLRELPAGPRNQRMSPGETIEVTGTGSLVTGITITRPGSIRIQISMSDPVVLDADREDSLNRFFGP